jgi:hypothetical protein
MVVSCTMVIPGELVTKITQIKRLFHIDIATHEFQLTTNMNPPPRQNCLKHSQLQLESQMSSDLFCTIHERIRSMIL